MKLWYLVALNIGMIVVILLAFSLGATYTIPDLTTVSYGFPSTWAIHTTNTIIGPVDQWNVNINALLIDLALWLSVFAIVNVAASLLTKRSK